MIQVVRLFLDEEYLFISIVENILERTTFAEE